jgi:hypothetical protein
MTGVVSTYERFRMAERRFDERDYRGAATLVERLLGDVERDGGAGHGLGDARQLLARSYYHSAQLRRAEETTRAILADDPADAYAALLLARVLERGSRREEAAGARRVAAALGA